MEMKLIEDFLYSHNRNKWLLSPEMKVYVRKGIRLNPLTMKPINCFEIANIDVYSPGQGIFTDWLVDVEELIRVSSFDAIYVENVQMDRFINFFIKQGWVEINAYGITKNFLKLVK